MDIGQHRTSVLKYPPWLSPLLSVTPQVFSIETLMAWQRFEIIQLFLNTRFPSWLDNNSQAGPQHVPVGPRQLQSQGGALDPGDLRHQHPRHQETRPAGGARHHQDPGGQGAVQISTKSIKQILILNIDNYYLDILYLWYLTEAADNQHRLHCEAEAGLWDGAQPLPSRCPGTRTKNMKIF